MSKSIQKATDALPMMSSRVDAYDEDLSRPSVSYKACCWLESEGPGGVNSIPGTLQSASIMISVSLSLSREGRRVTRYRMLVLAKYSLGTLISTCRSLVAFPP